MNALLRNTVLIVCAWLMLAGVCHGRQVYLKDGSIVDCESFWRRGGQVIVKINRDTIIDFEKSEIDLRRTFPEASNKTHHVRRKKTAGAVTPHIAATRTAESAVPSAPVMPKSSADAPAANPVPPPDPPTPPVTNQTVQPETVQSSTADPSSPPDKTELERQSRQAAQMMAEAIQKKDPELLKKAIEAQRSLMRQNKIQSAGRSLKFLLILFVVSLLIVVSTWVVFEKAGHSGWKSLIPIYNMYTLLIISGVPGWWLILLFIPVVGFVFYLLAMLSMAGKFGRGSLFGVGLCFLPMFFYPMLAFGGSKYEG